MEKFEVNILGCGSALPTTRHFASSQVINFKENLYMIDCGESSQLQFRRTKLNFNKLNHIFISHLHGDHCFGLPGIVSTLGLLGRTKELVIHAHADAESLYRPLLDYFCKGLPYRVIFNSISPQESSVILEEKSLKVTTIPLKHRVPTCGFLFEEKKNDRHIIREMIDLYDIPLYRIPGIKKGEDFVTKEGETIENAKLTKAPSLPRKYAYCSDTAYNKKIVPLISQVDLLYHEATFGDSFLARAKETFHSTAKQAAMIAQEAQVKELIIGHFSARYKNETPLLEEARTVFEKTSLAYEGATFSIGSSK